MLQSVRDGLRRWAVWKGRSANRQIFGHALALGGLAILAKLATVARDLVVAHHFGASDEVDAFLVAFLVPAYAVSMLYGTLSAAFLPTFVGVRDRQGRQAAQQLLSSCLGRILMGSIVAVALLLLTSQYFLPLVASRFTPEKLALTQSIFVALVLVLLVSGATHLFTAVLNAEHQFTVPAISPMLIPLSAIVALFTLWPAWGIYALVWGTVVGFCLETVVLAVTVKRIGMSLWPSLAGSDEPLRQVRRQYFAAVGSGLLMGSSTVIDQAMAASLAPGSVAVLNYGGKLASFVIGTATTSLVIAIFPYFSRMVARSDWNAVRHTLRAYVKLVLFISMPLTAVLILLSEPIARLLFERGAMTHETTQLVATVQKYYLLQLPFYTVGMLGVRLLSAMQGNDALVKVALINMVVNIIGNLVFSHYLGVAGIALSTSLVYAEACLVIYWILWYRLREASKGRDAGLTPQSSL